MENASASSPMNPHFFQPLLPGFHNHLDIPIKFFARHIAKTINEGKVKLRSDASTITWEVKMDGPKLTKGWQKFATSHSLRVGDVVIFRHDGNLLFHVTCFGPSCCEIQFDNDDDDDDIDEDDVIQISSDSDSKKKQKTAEARDHSCFVTRVTSSNLRKDMLYLPLDFSRSNGLVNHQGEITILNEDGEPWRLFLAHCKYRHNDCRVFFKGNRKKDKDTLTFKLVKTGATATPVFQLSSSSYTTNHSRFVTLTLTSSSLQTSKLFLPMQFVKLNGIENVRKVTLQDQYGFKRETSLQPEDHYRRMGLGKEWREFCRVNGVKIGESFKLKLIKGKEDTATHLLKFCSKISSNSL